MSDNLILDHLKAIRAEIADLRTVTLASVERTRRLERRLDEVRDDLELMIKTELMGRLGNFEHQIEARLDAMTERLSRSGQV